MKKYDTLSYNLALIKLLEAYMKRFPSLRFNQALAALMIDPESQFYEESHQTLSRITNSDTDRSN